ncbi:C45 family autoproteolytic acyltransferase/hydrolase [Streptomyces luomodiensis]|uniref:C45 family autoproteolytic acyltransferase/hydrolase n=1 Tax=Streptomyces luomodiensis TaxID=3026192 RepID=A0ABY9V8L7_9ACTN|nr:C45 family peptidase [Streptomyces sp. SCA4-21]WNF00962.1 C45 family autoproteolytic acyltransferase/hydrolase [Streptomyces sp. SCA4-21]
MGAHVREQEFAGLRWLVASGEREEVFEMLGQAARSEIRTVHQELPEAEALHIWARTELGSAHLRRLVSETRRSCPTQVRELRALAQGAGLESLMLANLRGDLGTDDGTGCTDLGWRRSRSYVAHNEDGAPALEGRLMLLTLLIDGDVPVTTQWYPGFLPANTYVATGHGLVWGINHIQATRPALAAGRHFVARALQQAPDLEAAVQLLRTVPSAGGFAYTIGARETGRVVVVEAVAGRSALVEAQPAHPLQWHTNHLRHHPLPLDVPSTQPSSGAGSLGQRAAGSLGGYEESQARGKVLAGLDVPDREPSVDWFLDALTSAPLPRGVYRTAAGSDPLMTLCTTVTDLDADSITLRIPGRPSATLPLSAYVRGNADAR